jgi:UDP-glucose 4-epimerase
MIGDHPNEVPANLAPYLARVASRNLNYINIFGNDYPTCDGTGERDYIHVMDLAEGHMAALDFLYKKLGLHIVNLGTGNSTSVLELLRSFERASGMPIPFKIATRREGDPPISYADVKLAREKFGWNAKRTLDDMSTSAWFFEKLNSKKLPYSE